MATQHISGIVSSATALPIRCRGRSSTKRCTQQASFIHHDRVATVTPCVDAPPREAREARAASSIGSTLRPLSPASTHGHANR